MNFWQCKSGSNNQQITEVLYHLYHPLCASFQVFFPESWSYQRWLTKSIFKYLQCWLIRLLVTTQKQSLNRTLGLARCVLFQTVHLLIISNVMFANKGFEGCHPHWIWFRFTTSGWGSGESLTMDTAWESARVLVTGLTYAEDGLSSFLMYSRTVKTIDIIAFHIIKVLVTCYYMRFRFKCLMVFRVSVIKLTESALDQIIFQQDLTTTIFRHQSPEFIYFLSQLWPFIRTTFMKFLLGRHDCNLQTRLILSGLSN